MSGIQTIELDCGLMLLAERIAGVRSMGLTWFLPAGTARDPDDRIGLSAMWEELLCRGAGDLDSRAQADAFDRLGASRDADAETFGHIISATMLGSRLPDALPLIIDMGLRPRMDADAVEPARDLCLQAIDSLADDPQERVMKLLREKHAPTPINRSGLGTVEGIEAISADELLPRWRERALPGGGVFAIAGDVDATKTAAQLNTLLKGWTGAATEITWGKSSTRGYHHEPDETNQAHIAIAWDAPSENEPGCWPERIANSVLSGGMSGRLFTEVREKRALCYSVYASYGADAKYGRGVAYVGTTPQRAQESLDVLMAELNRINTPAGKVTKAEFDRAIVGMKSRLVMSGESSSARAGAIARDWRKIGRARTLTEMAAQVDAVTLDQVNDYLSTRTLGEITIATIGPEPLTMK